MGVDSFGEVTRTGIFSTFPVNSDGMAVGTSASIMTFAGDTSLHFLLSLDTAAVASVFFGAGPGSTNAFASFADTFGFPTSGPVANLPDGYTLNSLDGSIVNNRFVIPQSVPQPSTLWLFGLGLVLVALLSWRRSRLELPRFGGG
jgi:hypothetical protein